jgi:hypothetical protein
MKKGNIHALVVSQNMPPHKVLGEAKSHPQAKHQKSCVLSPFKIKWLRIEVAMENIINTQRLTPIESSAYRHKLKKRIMVAVQGRVCA